MKHPKDDDDTENEDDEGYILTRSGHVFYGDFLIFLSGENSIVKWVEKSLVILINM